MKITKNIRWILLSTLIKDQLFSLQTTKMSKFQEYQIENTCYLFLLNGNWSPKALEYPDILHTFVSLFGKKGEIPILKKCWSSTMGWINFWSIRCISSIFGLSLYRDVLQILWKLKTQRWKYYLPPLNTNHTLQGRRNVF